MPRGKKLASPKSLTLARSATCGVQIWPCWLIGGFIMLLHYSLAVRAHAGIRLTYIMRDMNINVASSAQEVRIMHAYKTLCRVISVQFIVSSEICLVHHHDP